MTAGVNLRSPPETLILSEVSVFLVALGGPLRSRTAVNAAFFFFQDFDNQGNGDKTKNPEVGRAWDSTGSRKAIAIEVMARDVGSSWWHP